MTGPWEFVEDAGGRWRWRTSDAAGLRRESPETFRSGADCVAHALRNGYLAGNWACLRENPKSGSDPQKAGV